MFFFIFAAMKRKLSYIVLVFLALIISYGGSGVSFMIYCCQICQEHDMHVVEAHTCCELSDQCHSMNDEPGAYIHMDGHSFPCEVTRISFDWNTAVPALPVFQPMEVDLGFLSNISIALNPFLLIKEFVPDSVFDPPLPFRSRQYLALFSQFLI